MARVTSEEVIAIMTTDETNVDIQISIAHNFVNNFFANENTLTEETLINIELFLSAHFVYLKTPQLKSEKIGDSTDTYHVGALGKNLMASPYGQQALLLDTTNKLAQLGKQRASLKAIDLGL